MAPSEFDQVTATCARPASDLPSQVGPGMAENLTLTEATELLDWLEGHGIRAHEVCLNEAGLMTIRWGETAL